MSQSERAKPTRDKILLSAARLFDERGYIGAGMAEIVLGAGMTSGAVYYHFTSKADLARALVEDYHAAWPSIRKSAEGRQGLEGVHYLLERLATQISEDVLARAAIKLARESDLIDADVPTPFDDWREFIGYRLRQAQLLGEMRGDLDPTMYASIVVGMFLGVQEYSELTHLVPGSDVTVIRAAHLRVEAMWELILRGLATPATPLRQASR